jgi:hypothetical protein
MVKKAISHVHANTLHKDRLVLVALFAVLAFTVFNTVLISTGVVLSETENTISSSIVAS